MLVTRKQLQAAFPWDFDAYDALLADAENERKEKRFNDALAKCLEAASLHHDLNAAYDLAAKILETENDPTHYPKAMNFLNCCLDYGGFQSDILVRRAKLYGAMKCNTEMMADIKSSREAKIKEANQRLEYHESLKKIFTENKTIRVDSQLKLLNCRDTKDLTYDTTLTNGASEYTAPWVGQHPNRKLQVYNLQKALALYPLDVVSFTSLTCVVLAMGNESNARKFINILSKNFSFSALHLIRGIIFLKSDNDVEKFKASIKECLRTATLKELQVQILEKDLIATLTNPNEKLIELGDKAFAKQNWDSATYYYSLEILMRLYVYEDNSSKDMNDLYFKREWAIAHNYIQRGKIYLESSHSFENALKYDFSNYHTELQRTFDDFYRKAKKENAHNEPLISEFYWLHAKLFLQHLKNTNIRFMNDYKNYQLTADKFSLHKTEVKSHDVYKNNQVAELFKTYLSEIHNNKNFLIHSRLKLPIIPNTKRLQDRADFQKLDQQTAQRLLDEKQFLINFMEINNAVPRTGTKASKQLCNDLKVKNGKNKVLFPDFPENHYFTFIIQTLERGPLRSSAQRRNNNISIQKEYCELNPDLKKALELYPFNAEYRMVHVQSLATFEKCEHCVTTAQKYYDYSLEICKAYFEKYTNLLFPMLVEYKTYPEEFFKQHFFQVNSRYVLMADVAMYQDNYDLALHYLNAAVFNFNEDVLALTERAYCYLHMNNFEAATNDLHKVAKIAPFYLKALWLTIFVYEYLADQEKKHSALHSFLMVAFDDFTLLNLSKDFFLSIFTQSLSLNYSCTADILDQGIKEAAKEVFAKRNYIQAKILYTSGLWLVDMADKDFYYYQLIECSLNIKTHPASLVNPLIYYTSLLFHPDRIATKSINNALLEMKKSLASKFEERASEYLNLKEYSEFVTPLLVLAFILDPKDRYAKTLAKALAAENSTLENICLNLSSFINKNKSPVWLDKRAMELESHFRNNFKGTIHEDAIYKVFAKLVPQQVISKKPLKVIPATKIKKKPSSTGILKSSLQFTRESCVEESKEIKVSPISHVKNAKVAKKRKEKHLLLRLKQAEKYKPAPEQTYFYTPVVYNSSFFSNTIINARHKIGLLPIEKEILTIFKNNNLLMYLVGGSAQDRLKDVIQNIKPNSKPVNSDSDSDLVTSATGDEVEKALVGYKLIKCKWVKNLYQIFKDKNNNKVKIDIRCNENLTDLIKNAKKRHAGYFFVNEEGEVTNPLGAIAYQALLNNHFYCPIPAAIVFKGETIDGKFSEDENKAPLRILLFFYTITKRRLTIDNVWIKQIEDEKNLLLREGITPAMINKTLERLFLNFHALANYKFLEKHGILETLFPNFITELKSDCEWIYEELNSLGISKKTSIHQIYASFLVSIACQRLNAQYGLDNFNEGLLKLKVLEFITDNLLTSSIYFKDLFKSNVNLGASVNPALSWWKYRHPKTSHSESKNEPTEPSLITKRF